MSMRHIDLEQFKSKPHPYRTVFSQHGVAITTVANYLGMTYQYVYNCLSGHITMSKRMEEKLSPLIEQLQAEGGQ